MIFFHFTVLGCWNICLTVTRGYWMNLKLVVLSLFSFGVKIESYNSPMWFHLLSFSFNPIQYVFSNRNSGIHYLFLSLFPVITLFHLHVVLTNGLQDWWSLKRQKWINHGLLDDWVARPSNRLSQIGLACSHVQDLWSWIKLVVRL